MYSPTDKRQFHALDAARGIAALVVALYHWQGDLGVQVFGSGFLAVDFFFALSGFVIVHAYGDKLANGKISTRQFMLARFARLYPLYFLALFCMVALVSIKTALGMPAGYTLGALLGKLPFALLMLPSPTLDPHGYLYPFNIAAWSILFELFINFVFALFARRLLLDARVRWAVIAISGVALAFSVVGLGIEQGGPSFMTLPAGIARVSFSFFVGVQLYVWHTERTRRGAAPLHAGWGVLSLGVLTACLAVPATLVFDVVAVFVVFPLLIRALGDWNLDMGRVGTALRQLGVGSYALYMMHSVFGYLLFDVVLVRLGIEPHGALAVSVTLAVAVVSIVAISIAAERFFDRPLRKLLSRKLNRRTARVDPASARPAF